MPEPPPVFKSGNTFYDTVVVNENSYAVVRGKTLADHAFVFRIYPNEADPANPFFFKSAQTKKKSWELTDSCPGNENARNLAGAGAAASPASPTGAKPAAAASGGGGGSVPSGTSREEADRRLRAIYIKNNPSKLSDIKTILDQYAGRYDTALFPSLLAKYKSEPSPEERDQLIAQWERENGGGGGGSPGTPSSPTQQQQQQQSFSPPGAALAPTDGSSPTGGAASLSPRNEQTGAATAGADGRSDSPNTASRKEHYRQRVTAMFAKYAPDKLKNVEKQLKTYADHEDALIAALVAKFGPEPARADGSPQPTPIVVGRGEQQQFPETAVHNDSGLAILSGGQLAAAPAQAGEWHQQQQQQPLSHVSQKSGADTLQQPAQMAPTPRRAEMHTTATLTDVAPLPVPRAPLVTVDLSPMPPQRPSPIFDTAELLRAPASVRQELLLSFLQDRDDRLRDALDRNERYTSVIQQLQEGHDALAREIDNTRRSAQAEQDKLKQMLRDAQRTIETTKSKWADEKERSAAAATVATLQAQRDVHAQLIALEESKIAYGKEISDLKSKLAVSSHASKAVREEATALLSVLARKEEQVRAHQEELTKLQQKLQGPVRVAAAVQTQESLSDIIRSVAKHMSGTPVAGGAVSCSVGGGAGGAAAGAARSINAEQESFNQMSQQMGALAADHANNSMRFLPVALPNTCKRCSRGAAMVRCGTCRLALCLHCDNLVHSANRRFQAHLRIVIASAPERSTSSTNSGNQQFVSRNLLNGGNNNMNSSRSGSATYSDAQTLAQLLPEDIDRQLASGMDEVVFDRIIGQFDNAFSDRRQSKNDEVERLRAHVRELEESIAVSRSQAPGGPNSGMRRIPGTNNSYESEHMDTVRAQIEEEQRRNVELSARIQELESLLLASPDQKEFVAGGSGAGGAGSLSAAAQVQNERVQLEMQVTQLQRDLAAARAEVKEKRKEIAAMRSLLSAHMSTPYGVVAPATRPVVSGSAAAGGYTPKSAPRTAAAAAAGH